MILFDLSCANEHVFESWFKDGITYEKLASMGGVECPLCGDRKVRKAPMAPNLLTGKKRPAAQPMLPAIPDMAQPSLPSVPQNPEKPIIEKETANRLLKALDVLRKHIEKHFTDVGRKFPEEARKIHYGEAEKKNIFGHATQEEIQELKDEGIEIIPLPVVMKRDA